MFRVILELCLYNYIYHDQCSVTILSLILETTGIVPDVHACVGIGES